MAHRTLLHISDLHIGNVNRHGRSYSDPAAVTALNLYQFLPGNLGHDDRAMLAAARLYERLRAGATEVDLVVSGDVTAFAAGSHFDLAERFIQGRVQWPGSPRRFGLTRGGRQEGLVPGNHDYFAGKPLPPGGASAPLRKFFRRALPSWSWTVSLPDGRNLRFLEIDCDIDFEVAPGPRYAARESGEGHMRQLARELAKLKTDPPEVRVLIMHGSPLHRDGPLKLLELMYGAHQTLDSFCAAENVRAVLCGHTHGTLTAQIPFPSGAHTHELRCGTSMQVLTPHINPVTKRLIRRYLPAVHQALVHRIVPGPAGKVFWETEPHQLTAADTSFKSTGATYRFEL